MNWGHGITIAIIGFMSFILFLVYQTTKAEIDLVSTTYYEDELGYDARKEALERALPFAGDIRSEIDTDYVNYEIPSPGDGLNGTITFRHPRNQELDVHYAIDNAQFSVSRDKLDDEVPYNVIIAFNSGSQEYRIETKLILL